MSFSTTSTRSTGGLVKSAPTSAEGRLCHVCGGTFAKALLPAHQRSCVKRSIRASLASGNSSRNPGLERIGMAGYPCTGCMQNIPQHKLSEHLRLCKAPTSAPPLHPYASTTSFHTSSAPNLYNHQHQQQPHYTQPFETPRPQEYETQPLHFKSTLPRTQSYQHQQPSNPPQHQQHQTRSIGLPKPTSLNRSQTQPTPFATAAESPTRFIPAPQKSIRENVPKAMYAVDNGRRGGGLSGGGQFGRDQYDVESKYKQEEVVEEEEAPMTYYSEEVEEVDGIPAYQNEEPRFPCPVCGRKFMAQDRLEKHANACNKVQKPRKVFDATKARTKGTELEQYVVRARVEKEKEKKGWGKKNTSEDLPLPAQHSKPSWKIKHENFIQMVRAARQPPPSKSSSSSSRQPPPPSQIDPSLIPCDSCGRRFNPDTAERHIPICKAQKMRQVGSGVKGKEEMLRKRVAYRPPVPKGRSPGKGR